MCVCPLVRSQVGEGPKDLFLTSLPLERPYLQIRLRQHMDGERAGHTVRPGQKVSLERGPGFER